MQDFTWGMGFTSDVTTAPGGLVRSFCLVLCCAESTFHESEGAQKGDRGDGELPGRPGDGEEGADPDRFKETMPQSPAEV